MCRCDSKVCLWGVSELLCSTMERHEHQETGTGS